jgi:ATP-dependent Clp protease ATP-binding subunit ClpC
MRRAVQKELEDPLSILLLEGDCPPGTVFTADALDGKITVRPARRTARQPAGETVQPAAL